MATVTVDQPLPPAFRILIRRFNDDPRGDSIMIQGWTPRGWRDYCTCASVRQAREILVSRGVHTGKPVIRNRRTAPHINATGR